MSIDWTEFDPSGEEPSEPDESYTDAEVEVRNMIMAEFNKQVLKLRERSGDVELSALFSLILDEAGFEGTTYHSSMNTLIITSSPSDTYKYTALTVSPEKSNENNRYFYAIDIENYPIANEKLNLAVYTEWNGEDELEVEYGKTIIIVETNLFRRAIRYGTVQANSNRG
jgi:hypothetical protein